MLLVLNTPLLWNKAMKFETYAFQNIYLITTYRCNWKCDFCLFRFNYEKETDICTYIERVEYAIKNSDRKVYIKITGGEPFVYPELLRAILGTLHKYKDKIYKIGIGSNGSIPIPEFFNKSTIKTHIFLSRHDIDKNLPSVKELSAKIDNPMIDFRVNCNLIKGKIDNVEMIKKTIEARSDEFTHFCFRELSAVDIDANSIYPKQIYEYIQYYKDHLVKLDEIEKEIYNSHHPDFVFTRNTGNAYDKNHWYWYKKHFSVKFRAINEKELVAFNERTPGIDEYVVHPDGTLTGCWDKDRKIIMKGGV